MKQLRDEVTYRMIFGAVYTFSLLPIATLYIVSDLIYIFLYYVFQYRKPIVIQNLSRSFPDKKYEEIHAISKKFYKSFADYFAEILKTISISPQKIEAQVSFVGFQAVDELVAEGKNVIACLGHCGNWEMLNALPLAMRSDVYAIYKPLRNTGINRLMIHLRSRFGVKPIASKLVAKHILRRTQNPALYLFLSDQCPKQVNENNKYQLLNQETAIFNGVEKLANATNSAVVYIHIIQVSRGNYKITCMPLFTESQQDSDKGIMKEYVRLLENNIMDEPFGWLWTHKRWKR